MCLSFRYYRRQLSQVRRMLIRNVLGNRCRTAAPCGPLVFIMDINISGNLIADDRLHTDMAMDTRFAALAHSARSHGHREDDSIGCGQSERSKVFGAA